MPNTRVDWGHSWCSTDTHCDRCPRCFTAAHWHIFESIWCCTVTHLGHSMSCQMFPLPLTKMFPHRHRFSIVAQKSGSTSYQLTNCHSLEWFCVVPVVLLPITLVVVCCLRCLIHYGGSMLSLVSYYFALGCLWIISGVPLSLTKVAQFHSHFTGFDLCCPRCFTAILWSKGVSLQLYYCFFL